MNELLQQYNKDRIQTKIMHFKIINQIACNMYVYVLCMGDYFNWKFCFYWRKDIVSILQMHEGAYMNLDPEYIYSGYTYILQIHLKMNSLDEMCVSCIISEIVSFFTY